MNKKKIGNIIISTLLTLSFVFAPISGTVVSAASLPKYNAKGTDENVLKLLEAYDPNGYLFVKTDQDVMAVNPSMWYHEGDKLVEEINTTVHEACHHYCDYLEDLDIIDGRTLMKYGFHVADNKDLYLEFYIGDPVFSNEMAQDVPEELRVKWGTYIGDECCDTAANQYGVYGMMDEFNAYGWGLNNTLCMYEYLKDTVNEKTARKWLKNRGLNDIEAYYEYQLWIHMYLKHAQEHYPDFYASLVNNKGFIEVYKAINKRYKASMKQYKKITGKKGMKKYRKQVLAIINSDEYKEIRDVLKGKEIDTSAYVWNGAMQWTSIRYVAFDEEGLKIRWANTGDSDGFEIYRKAGKGDFSLIKDIVKDPGEKSVDISYIDKTIKDGKTYTYYVIPYKKNADGTRTYGEKSLERKKDVKKGVKPEKAVYKNGEITVSWKKLKEKNIKCIEIGFTKEKEDVTVTLNDGSTTITHGGSSTVTHYIYEADATSYTCEPDMGSGEYKVNMRVAYEVKGKKIFSPWSEEITLNVKD